MTRARISGGVADHFGKAVLAATFTAASTSALLASATLRLDLAGRRVEHVAETAALAGDLLAVDEMMQGLDHDCSLDVAGLPGFFPARRLPLMALLTEIIADAACMQRARH